MYSLLVEVLNNAMLVAEGETAETGMICGSEKVAYTNSLEILQPKSCAGCLRSRSVLKKGLNFISSKPLVHKVQSFHPVGSKGLAEGIT